MHATTKSVRNESSTAVMLAVDLAKDVFELAFADAAGRIVARKRLKRGPFAECLENRAPLRIVMEACGLNPGRFRTPPACKRAGRNDGPGKAHRKAECTNATAPVCRS